MSITVTTVMPFFYPATHMGGPVAQAYELGRRMVARGHTVSVVTTDIGIAPVTARNEWLDVEGMRVWYGSTRPWHRVVPYWEPQLQRPLEEVLPNSDVVHVRMGLTLLNDLVRRMCRRYGRPYVYTAEGALCPKRLQLKSLRKAFFLRLVESRVLAQADVLHALTTIEQRDLLAQGASRERIEIIPNGVELQPVAQADGKPFRRGWNVPDDAKVVLYFGRITRLKGIEPLLRGFARCAKQCDQSVLVIAGHGDGEEHRLSRLAEELGIASRIRMPGAIQGAER